MADIARHLQAGIEINGTIESAIIRDSVQVAPEIKKELLYAGGDVVATLAATLTSKPIVKFKTRNIDLITAPTVISGAGVAIAMRAYADNGGPGTAYISMTIATGLIVPEKLTAQQGQPAELECAVYGTSSDGDAVPIVIGTTAKALGVHGDAHTLGDLTIGSAIAGIQSFDLDFGYQIKTNEGENGKTYPTLVYYEKQESKQTMKTTALSAATAVRLTTGQATTAISATLRKLAEGGVVSDTGAVTITIAKGIVEAQNLQSGEPYSLNLLITPVYDGSGDDYLVFS